MFVHLAYFDRFYLKGTNDTTLEVIEWTSPNSIDLETALQRAEEWIGYGFENVTVFSATTGELIAECGNDEPEPEDSDDFEDVDDFDDDVDECGYNPYMGCYDYDC